MKGRGQSLVEFALIAPIVILLAMAAWDGGSVLREQVVLQQAARDGARVAATSYGGATTRVVQDAVLASAADLPALRNSSGYFNLSSDSQSVTVRLAYAHSLITPVLRQLWGGSLGIVMLSATATFYLPQQTPVPPAVTPSTPVPTATPTPASTATSTATPTPVPTSTPTLTPTPTQTSTSTSTPTSTLTPTPTRTPTQTLSPTPTSTSTPGPVVDCFPDFDVPGPLSANSGFYVTLQLTVPSWIGAGWSVSEAPGGQMELYLYAGTPFSGANPSATIPPSGWLAMQVAPLNQPNGVALVSSQPAGTYTIYFFKRSPGSLTQPSEAALGYQSGVCPPNTPEPDETPTPEGSEGRGPAFAVSSE